MYITPHIDKLVRAARERCHPNDAVLASWCAYGKQHRRTRSTTPALPLFFLKASSCQQESDSS
jgi:hypothetical protein